MTVEKVSHWKSIRHRRRSFLRTVPVLPTLFLNIHAYHSLSAADSRPQYDHYFVLTCRCNGRALASFTALKWLPALIHTFLIFDLINLLEASLLEKFKYLPTGLLYLRLKDYQTPWNPWEVTADQRASRTSSYLLSLYKLQGLRNWHVRIWRNIHNGGLHFV